MALLADDARDRVEQLLLVTERLAALIGEETRRIEARQPPLDGADSEERNRLANAYRLELTRIKHEPDLIAGAPPQSLALLKTRTEALNAVLADHETALSAIKLVTEGLVQAMADEVARQRNAGQSYGSQGALEPRPLSPTVLDRSA
ncbi:MAG: flagellar basal body protein [Hyphomonadaceae bacterium]|nr:flagellar basal body protein [Hyphomonadaceae bacterium]